jgi:peptide/nickel transport system ATP-binding protein
LTSEDIIEIEDLYVNFCTRNGVVQALDGLNLKIRRGETLGLVGESGCGKSVTANSILRLVPSPPGQVGKGRILFRPPIELGSRFQALWDLESKGGTDGPEAIRARGEYEDQLRVNHMVLSSQRDGYRRLRELESRQGRNAEDTEAARAAHLGDLNRFNILDIPEEDLRRIRGKAISMIFQEPMSSLNPVITAGDQISEAILLHERKDLAAAVVERFEREAQALRDYKRTRKVKGKDDDLRCSGCGTLVRSYHEYCPQCNSSFYARAVPLSRLRLRILGRLYQRMTRRPDDRLLLVMAKLPLLRRYEGALEQEATKKAIDMLALVRVPDPVHVAGSYPFELSGGMQQRVMIAMALACRPQLLIADEPTTALDVTIQAQILRLMRELQEAMGTSILLITHNFGIVAESCDRVGVMYAGNIVELASSREIFKEPLHPYTQGLLAAIPRIDTELPRLETIEGNVPDLTNPPAGCRFHPRCPYAMDACRKEKPLMNEVRPGHAVACHLYAEVKT